MRSNALFSMLVLTAFSITSSAVEDNELANLRQQIEQLKKDYEQRLQTLEARLEQAEKAAAEAAAKAKMAPEKAQVTAESPLNQAVKEAISASAPEERPRAAPTSDLWLKATGDSRLRLLDVSFDILAAAGWSTQSDSTIEELQGGEHDPRRRGFTLQQGELSLMAAVDPYFTAESHIIFTDKVVELEEAFFTTTSLPANLQLEGGFFFTEFGRLNPLHPHAWHWIDQPLINTRLLGPEGARGAGFRLAWLMPIPWFSELHFGAQDPSNKTLVSFLGEGDIHGNKEGGMAGIGGFAIQKQDLDSPSDLLYLARWVNAWDLNPEWSAQLGLSALHGPNTTGDEGDTWIYDLDLVAKWRPATSFRGWPFLVWETEVMSRDYEVDTLNTNFVPGGTDDTLNDWGLYTQVLYGFKPRWAAGLRFEYASGGGDGETPRDEDPFRANRYRVSPLLVYHLSEFSRLRLQYNYDNAKHLENDTAHSVWLGFEVLYGAHPAHKY
jgi:Uncharacterized protein conserved in bacteria